jgi:hypothetical protein
MKFVGTNTAELNLGDVDDLPRHIQSFAREVLQSYRYLEDPNEQEYSDAAMALVSIAGRLNGSDADLDKLKDFIVSERRQLRASIESRKKLLEMVERYIFWSSRWAVHRDDYEQIERKLKEAEAKNTDGSQSSS